MIYDDYHFEKIAFHFSTVNQYIIYPKKKDMFIYDQIQLFFIFRTIPIRETFRSRCIPLLQRVINLLINRHPTILETNFNSPMMGRITHLSISIARGASTSRCIHIDDTCLITLGMEAHLPASIIGFVFVSASKSFDTNRTEARGRCHFDKHFADFWKPE